MSEQAQLDTRRRNVRRSALLLTAVALFFYFGYIVMSVVHAKP